MAEYASLPPGVSGLPASENHLVSPALKYISGQTKLLWRISGTLFYHFISYVLSLDFLFEKGRTVLTKFSYSVAEYDGTNVGSAITTDSLKTPRDLEEGLEHHIIKYDRDAAFLDHRD